METTGMPNPELGNNTESLSEQLARSQARIDRVRRLTTQDIDLDSDPSVVSIKDLEKRVSEITDPMERLKSQKLVEKIKEIRYNRLSSEKQQD